jgi:hypothetical protein
VGFDHEEVLGTFRACLLKYERFLRFLRETGVLINLFQLLNKGSSNLDLLCLLIIKKKRIIFINHAHETRDRSIHDVSA